MTRKYVDNHDTEHGLTLNATFPCGCVIQNGVPTSWCEQHVIEEDDLSPAGPLAAAVLIGIISGVVFMALVWLLI